MTKTTKQSDSKGNHIDNGYVVLTHEPTKGLQLKSINSEKATSDVIVEVMDVTDVEEPRVENSYLTLAITNKIFDDKGNIVKFEVNLSASCPIIINAPEVNINGKLKVNGVTTLVP